MKVWLIAALLALGFASYGAEQEAGVEQEKVIFSVTTDEDGTRSEISARPDQVAASPTWDGEGEPPLAISAAVKAASDWMKDAHPGFTEFTIQRLELARVYAPGASGRWTYQLTLDASGMLGGVVVKHQFQAVVLLDGTVIQPTPYKEEAEEPGRNGGRENEQVEAKR